MKNFTKIAASLISMIHTTSNHHFSTIANKKKTNHNAPSSASDSYVGKVIKNLSTIANLINFKKAKNFDFTIANSSKIDFLTLKANNTFIFL